MIFSSVTSRSRALFLSATLVALASLPACNRGEEGQVVDADAAERAAKYPDARAHIRGTLGGVKDTSVIATLVGGDTITLSSPTVRYYQGVLRRGKPVWSEGVVLLPRGRQLIQALGKTEDDGLSPTRYRYDAIQRSMQALANQPADSLIARHLADLDLLLTEGFNRYAMDLTRGTVDPSEVRAWKIPRARPWEENLLRMMVRGTPPEEVIQRLRPSSPYYARMMQALKRHRDIMAKGGWPQVPEGKIAVGDSSAVVAALRSRLALSDDAREVSLAAAGQARPMVFDDDLKDALRHYQDRHAIEPDGALGKATLHELNEPITDRVAELTLNIDRWRWMPHDLGDFFVLVNVAGFELEVVENNVAIEKMNVVVGQPGWQTPIFQDTMEHIVINPSWNVPPSIAEQEIGPALARDPGYLEKNNMVRTKDGGYRQLPGPDNALGDFKFIFPNEDNIYLHDTPAQSLFSRTRRAFSHGCIRLERPDDLANLIATKATRSSVNDIRNKLRSGQESWVKLTRTVPVYILYFTTWVDEDGTTHFYHDVYGHDKKHLGDEQVASAR